MNFTKYGNVFKKNTRIDNHLNYIRSEFEKKPRRI